MSTKNERMMEAIERQGRALEILFPSAKKSGVALCKALRRLEVKAHRLATDECNGEGFWAGTAEDCQKGADEEERITDKARDLLGLAGDLREIVFFNSDARGYTLNVNCTSNIGQDGLGYQPDALIESGIVRDWGGYGILAPDLRES